MKPMKNWVYIFLGVFAAQRFILGDLYHFAPIAPLTIAVYWLLKSPKQAGIFVMMALFFTADLGGEIYNTTTSPVKYATYIIAILVLIQIVSSQIKTFSAISGLALVVIVALSTLAYSIDSASIQQSSTAVRDVLLLLCIGICLFNVKAGRVDLEPLYYASLGFLGAEVINLMLLFDRVTHHYMSFASIKAFIIFPLFYRLYVDRKVTFASTGLAIPILLVMLAYNSKMVIFSLAFALLAMLIGMVYKRPAHILWLLLGPLALLGLFQLTLLLFPDVGGNRILSFLTLFAEGKGVFATIEELEPIRWHQHYLFFSRGILEIFFGNGIGAGIRDAGGQLANVANETAFTVEEMRDSAFFNFHDIWIDFGLRFGLVSVAFIVVRLTKILADPDTRAMGAVFLMILINATFSISGVFMAVLFYKIILQQPERSNRTNRPRRHGAREQTHSLSPTMTSPATRPFCTKRTTKYAKYRT